MMMLVVVMVEHGARALESADHSSRTVQYSRSVSGSGRGTFPAELVKEEQGSSRPSSVKRLNLRRACIYLKAALRNASRPRADHKTKRHATDTYQYVARIGAVQRGVMQCSVVWCG